MKVGYQSIYFIQHRFDNYCNTLFMKKIGFTHISLISLIFFLLFLTSTTCLLLTVTDQQYLVFRCNKNISSKFENQTGNSFYIMAKLRKPISLQSKRPKFFLGTQSCLTEEEKKYDYKPNFLKRDSESCMS